MNNYLKPSILSFTKEEVENKIKAYASGCSDALCSQGSTYTCNTGTPYACNNYSEGSNPCPTGYGFTCSSAISHTDSLKSEIT